MKKKFSLIMLFVLLATLLLVSCNPESSALDETIDVSLSGLNRTERSLDSKLEAFNSQAFVWKYKAVKKDNSGFTTGEKTEETLLPANGSIGSISQGYWEFTLFGYKDSTLVYEGKTEARVAKSSSNNTKITILVTPKQTASGKGTLLVDSDILKNGNYKVVVSLTSITNTSSTNTDTFDVVNGSLSHDMRITDLPSGSYTVEVSFVNEDDNGTITYVKEPVVVNIYDALETIVYGSVSETLENVTLTPTSEGSVLATTEKAFDSTQKTTITVNSSPLSEEKSTEIVIPKDTILKDENGNSITADTVKLEITTHPVTSSVILSSVNFTVEDDKSVVAALDISLSAGDKEVKSFGGEKVTITTYIAKGLNNVSVKYSGVGVQPDAVPNYETDAAWATANTETGYSKESGKLTFTTTHFSSYYVVTDAVAIDSEGNVYNSLQTALDRSKDKIVLIRDIDLTDQLVAPTSKRVLDLNGHTLSSDFNKGVIKLINRADLTITGNGTIKENKPSFAPIIVHGSLMNNVKLTIKDGVTLEGWSGVFVNQNGNKNKGIDIELDNITINAKDDSDGYNGTAIYVNGQITETTKCPVIKIKNSTLNSTGNGIYAAGNADWTLDNNTINASVSGIEIRAGKMVINSGSTSTSASSFTSEANDSGSTTNGAAVVVSQHNTTLPINVTINGGTFSGPVKLAVVNTIGDKLSKVTVNTNNKISSSDIKILPEENFEIIGGIIINSKLSTANDAASFERAFNDASVTYVKLTNDISLSGKSISFSSGNKTIDLDGNTLTLDSGSLNVVISNGSLFTIKNGTVKLPTTETTTIKPIDLNNGGKLYLENVTFDTDDTTLSCFFDCSDSQSELYFKDLVKEKNIKLGSTFKLFKHVLTTTFNYNFDFYNFENGKYVECTEKVNDYLLNVSWS